MKKSLPIAAFTLLLLCSLPARGQAIQWLQIPTDFGTPVNNYLLPNPSGANSAGTWVVTNLGCYGRVLITQTSPVGATDFINPDFENVPNGNGLFVNLQPGFGPFSWGYCGGLNFHDGNARDNYSVTFYFLDGAPVSPNVVLAALGLGQSTAATVSQPVVFRGEFDLSGSAFTSITNQPYNITQTAGSTNAGTIGTIIGSYYNVDSNGDNLNTGFGIFQPTGSLQTTNLPGGSAGFPASPSPVPYLSLAVSQEQGDGMGFTLGYICPTNNPGCLQIQCSSNIVVTSCTNIQIFYNPPTVTDLCCTNASEVLAAGGVDPMVNNPDSLSSAELYGVGAGTWAYTGSMSTPRDLHTATLLNNGQVLVAGGENENIGALLSTAELYNPGTGTWTLTGSMSVARGGAQATLLGNGTVLIEGGSGTPGAILSSAELYNPGTGTWTLTGSTAAARVDHTATLLPNGKVLVAGGDGLTASLSSAELYDPATGSWTATGSMNVGRYLHTATLLPNGKVLVAGGINLASNPVTVDSAELYDPATGLWTITGPMTQHREEHSAVLLNNGQVLVEGGGTTTSELYNPVSGTWTASGAPANNGMTEGLLLPDGEALIEGSTAGTTDLFDPATGIWTLSGPLNHARFYHTATLLPNWQVICTPPSGSFFSPGTTNTVICEVVDNCGNRDSCSFTVTVLQNTNPSLFQGPSNILVYSCTNVTVSYPPPVVVDPCCGTNWSIVYNPPSGTSFAPGKAGLVDWSISDCTGTNVASGSFWVSVYCTNCCQGALTNYTVPVLVGSNYLADCLCQGTNNTLADVVPNVPSGTTAYFWNSAAGQFTPPDTFMGTGWKDGTEPMYPGEGFVLVSYSNQFSLTIYGIEPGCGSGCSPIECSSPTLLIGDYGINPNPVLFCDLICCSPVPGTKVQVWDAVAQSFTDYTYSGSWSPSLPPPLPVGYSDFVSVDTSLPVINCPGDITTNTCGLVPVFFTVTASNAYGGGLNAYADPVSGTVFGVGTNVVTCAVTNACGGVSTCSFNIIVTCSGPGPGIISPVISGGTLTLTWAPGQNWTLQYQTNGLNPNNWATVTGATDGHYATPVGTTKGAVFYRLKYP